MHLDYWQGHKVRLRALHESDAEIVFASHRDSDTWRYADDIKRPPNLARVQANIVATNNATDDNCWLAIIDAKDALVGTVSVHGADRRHSNFEYGVHILRQHRQAGYASEAVRLIMRYYFKELNYHRIWSTVYEFNHASIALHEHLGFRREGCLRDGIFTNGRFWDEYVFGLLAKEAEAQLAMLPALPEIVGTDQPSDRPS